MDPVAAFFGMSGYGAFVWPSFAITVVVLVGLLLVSTRFMKTSERTLSALEGSKRGVPATEGSRETQA